MKVLIALLALATVAYGGVVPKLFAPMNGRIIGGIEATPHEFPMIISLKYQGSHRCGGAVIAANKVLTAAHCVDGTSASSLQVWAGAHNQQNQEPNQQRIAASSFVMHPNWNPNTINADVAVITLSANFQFNDYVSASCIPTQGRVPSGATWNIGWGLTSNGGSVSAILRKVEIDIVPRATCESIYQSINPITAGMVCARKAGQNAGSCNGDSGSPLLCNKDTSSEYICGVVSWGIGGNCGNPSYPSVFANPAEYSNWIVQNAAGTQTCA
jgi:secreted trypsin-like serine protease